MIPVEILAAFFVAALVLALSPGPDNIFVLAQSALRGASTGLAVTLGLCTGLIVHTAAVALGVAAILKTSATAFLLLKLAGAAYLLYLAFEAFRARPEAIRAGRDDGRTHWQFYRRGIVMNVANPKVSIFFLAFLPQFASPERGPMWLQILLLGGIFMVAAMLVFGSIALAAGRLGPWLDRRPRVQLLMHRLAGAVFVLLALSLVLAQRQ
jgi:threonine/homoserine/homoserine lactone efflux protein